MKFRTPLVLLTAALLSSCCSFLSKTPTLEEASYGKLSTGEEAKLITITNSQGTEATFTDFGAILVSLKTADRNGKIADITHGYDTIKGWENQGSYMGATAGRYANRIAKGQFSIDGKEYKLVTNNGPNHLHGGTKGFDKYLYESKTFQTDDAAGVIFTRTSKDGEEGYPGNLKTTVIYTLNNDNELKVEMKATTDKTTIVNIAHHTYWNLTGNPKNTILGHQLQLNASYYVPVDKTLIPTGEIRDVKGTPFNFTSPKLIGKEINAKNTQLEYGNGYDHCWVVDGKPNELRQVAVLHDPKTGRTMELIANQPGVQFYAGNFLDGKVPGKAGEKYQFRTAMCLETQVFPDSPNQLKFQSPILLPNQEYYHVMIHKFSAK